MTGIATLVPIVTPGRVHGEPVQGMEHRPVETAVTMYGRNVTPHSGRIETVTLDEV